MIIAVVFFEVSMIINVKDWVVDFGITRHIYGNISEFTSYTTIKDWEEQVFMSDSRTSPVIGKGKVLLKLTLGKMSTLSNVFHVPKICLNLVLVSLLKNIGMRIFFDSDEITLTKNDVFVWKGYCNKGIFMLNVF